MDEEMMPPPAAGMGAPEMQGPQADPQLLESAKALVQDVEFAPVLQWSRENAKTFADGIANALLLPMVSFQQTHQLDDETALGPVLVTMVVAALEIASEGGDDEATPDQIDAIRDTVIDRLGRMDAEAEAQQGQEMPEEMPQEQPQPRQLTQMLGA